MGFFGENKFLKVLLCPENIENHFLVLFYYLNVELGLLCSLSDKNVVMKELQESLPVNVSLP